AKKNRRSIRLKRNKGHQGLLEDRVWTLLYRMGFTHLSTVGGGILFDPKGSEKNQSNQITVVGINEDIALAINCIALEHRGSKPDLSQAITDFSRIRSLFSRAANYQFYPGIKQQPVLALFTNNINVGAEERERARNESVVIFDDQDLVYYESLVSHLGPAAKYQFFADMLPGKPVSALVVRVPAVKTRMGGTSCYTFSISPEYLLKIAYVSHRSKGKASDVHTYQRMLSRSRLNKIRKYISDDGIFPTNIVVNMESKRIRFERIPQDD